MKPAARPRAAPRDGARLAAAVLGIVGLALLPFVFASPYYLSLAVFILIYSIVALGLDVLFGYTGEVSIGHAALFGIGAYTAGILADKAGLGLLWALPAGFVVAGLFGMVLALPALRVTGPYLAMVTLAFGTIVQTLFNEASGLTRGSFGITVKKPLFFDLSDYADTLPFLDMKMTRMRDIEYYYLVAIFFVAAIVVVNRILASRYGRAFEALRDSPIACDCTGVSVYRHKVYAVAISAAFAGLAGALFTYANGYIAPNSFGFDLSIQFLLAVTLGGRKSRLGPILGAGIVVLLPNFLSDIGQFRIIAGAIAGVAVVAYAAGAARDPEARGRLAVPVALCLAFFALSFILDQVTDYKLAIFGVMILFVVYYLPDGIVGFIGKALLRLRRAPTTVADHEEASGDALRSGAAAGPTDGPLLRVENLTMRFGGLKALDAVDLAVAPGTIHGLIGPNGSGKSTMMNVLTGIYVPTEGSVDLGGTRVTGLGSPEIALRGIARTFQNVQLFGELSLLQNVLVGLNHTYRSGLAEVALALPRAAREEAGARARAMGILRFVGLDALGAEEARNLPYGKQRLLEIGRALALDPKLLLLDEPAAGLTAPDIAELMRIIRKIRDSGITVVLIEHHMDVVMNLCDRVSVLDFGHKIAEGRPAEVQADPKVLEAYLGGAAAPAPA